ncbi:MAG: hybrid sensor histidine kinase/response regulator [Bryobacteraceae bacterium]
MNSGEQRVLIVAPVGRDATLASNLLAEAGLPAGIVADLRDLPLELMRDAGAILLTEEALSPAGVENLLEGVRAQEAWSDIPLVLLTTAGRKEGEGASRLLKKFGELGNITILERPVRIETLRTAVRMALRARRRQYQMRDYLEERRRQEEKLRETQKLESIGVLAGGVAHDFNNLLTGILGNASLLLEDAAPGSFEHDALEEIVKSGERASDLTQQLLAYAGKGKFHIRSLQLSDLVGQIGKLVGNFIPKTAELRLDAGPDVPRVDCDSGQLQQIVMNLIINAGEALEGRPGGLIRVTTSVCKIDRETRAEDYSGSPVAPGTYVCLRVEDNGTGIDRETGARMFDPFFTTKFQGRGLGLAAVLGIVRSHRGYLQVESELGSGTIFTVLLPPGVRQEALTPPPTTPVPPVPRGKTVLVVDDEEVVRSVAQRTLEASGYQVHIAENGLRALDRFRAGPEKVDVVLLDLTMPLVDGEETYRRLQQLRPGISVILSSGYSSDALASRFAGRGFAGFLQKPYSARQLVETVARVLGGG